MTRRLRRRRGGGFHKSQKAAREDFDVWNQARSGLERMVFINSKALSFHVRHFQIPLTIFNQLQFSGF